MSENISGSLKDVTVRVSCGGDPLGPSSPLIFFQWDFFLFKSLCLNHLSQIGFTRATSRWLFCSPQTKTSEWV